MTAFVALIPARRASTRLPDKVLADLAGKPMVVHVADRARASGARLVVVATDDAEVRATVEAHGHSALLNHREHAKSRIRDDPACGSPEPSFTDSDGVSRRRQARPRTAR